MLKRVFVKEPILFAGDVAGNLCMHHLLEKAFGKDIMLPEILQMVGALGAALLAGEKGRILFV
ncbi:MAG: hypothetical protein SWH54_08875 [Thermodesulfobacteriota bacterium]|nr:hypothetical protein [Thermodesulfobacteriota bacterium]